jgi:hypothetical protein
VRTNLKKKAPPIAVKLLETFTLVAKATGRQRKLDYMREIPLVHCAGRFALAAAHGKLVVRLAPPNAPNGPSRFPTAKTVVCRVPA